MATLPLRGPAVRGAGLLLPPRRMPGWRAGRPLKRWRYVGIYTPDLMLCVGDARIGPVPQRWWAVALPNGDLYERTTFGTGGVALESPWTAATTGYTGGARGPSRLRVAAGDVRIDIELTESAGVEALSPVGEGGAYVWTRKQACVPVRGTIEIDGGSYAIDGDGGFVDDSAGYHARHTTWSWSAGVGRTTGGQRVGWNLVTGLHDDPFASERTLWVDGEPKAVAPVTFAEDLSEIASQPRGGAHGEGGVALRFDEWSVREHATNALILRSRYRQPFGTFGGRLPGGLELAEGCGVMERHDVHW